MAPYKHVIVGTDGSDTAADAVRHAGALAAAVGAELTIVTAFSQDPSTTRAAADAPAEVQRRISDAAGAEERAAGGKRIAVEAGAPATSVHTYVEAGEPAAVVLDTAKVRNADVIVVGSKGMTSAKRFVVGSVPNRISHHAPCDVIIVHTAP